MAIKKATNNHEKVVKYLQEYDRFLYKIALSVKIKCKRLEIEDIKNEIILVILTNYDKYDDSKCIKYSSYYSQIAINAANNIVRKYWQEKNRINVTCVSLDEYVEEHKFQYITMFKDEDESILYPENMYALSEITRKISDVKSKLNSFEKKVFELHFQGKDVEKIAIKLKKSKKTIYYVLACIKEKIKNSI